MVKYNYLRGKAGKGRRITVARLVEGGLLSVGYSTCHPDDQFNKVLGRKIANGRLYNETEKSFSVSLSDDEQPIVKAMTTLSVVAEEFYVREMAKEWLFQKTE